MNKDEKKFILKEYEERLIMKEYQKTQPKLQIIYTEPGTFTYNDGWFYSGGSELKVIEIKIREGNSDKYNSVLLEKNKFDNLKKETNEGEFIYATVFEDIIFLHKIDTSLHYYSKSVKCDKTTAISAPKEDKQVIFLDYNDAFHTGSTTNIDRTIIKEKAIKYYNNKYKNK